jgi:hypothetical protein
MLLVLSAFCKASATPVDALLIQNIIEPKIQILFAGLHFAGVYRI